MTAALLVLLTSITAASGSDAQLLCFGATWCQPCQEMKPALDQLSRDGYPVQKIDVDQHSDLAKKYEVAAVPSFVLVDRNGRVMDRIDQATSRKTLSRMLAHYEVRPRPTTVRGQNPIAVPDVKTPKAPSARTGEGFGARSGATQPFAQTSTREASSQAAPGVVAPGVAASNALQETPSRSFVQDDRGADPVASALASTIRLRVEDDDGHSFGTGTVVDVHGQEALVLTCGHIFRPSEGKGRILMDRFDSPTAEPTTGSLISYDMDLDVALVSMKLTRPIKIARLAPLAYKALKGEPVYSVGCSRGKHPPF